MAFLTLIPFLVSVGVYPGLTVWPGMLLVFLQMLFIVTRLRAIKIEQSGKNN
jgi:hypothetical protein